MSGNCERHAEASTTTRQCGRVTRAAKQLAAALRHPHTRKGNHMSQSATTPLPDEFDQVDRANASGKQPVIFAHGLWLLDNSWEARAQFFEEAGYVAVTPSCPTTPRASPTRASIR